MGKVARQVVEQAGVDVNVLLDKLVRAAGAEFTTFYYYTILRVNAIGFDGEGLKEIIEDARIGIAHCMLSSVSAITIVGNEQCCSACVLADASCQEPPCSRAQLTLSHKAATGGAWLF